MRAILRRLSHIGAARHRLIRLLPSHLIQSLYPCASGLLRHAHSHKSGHRAGRVRRRRTHGVRLRPGQRCRSHPRIPHHRGFLELLDHVLILFGRSHAVHPEGVDLDSPKLRPFLRQHLIQSVRKLHRMPRQGTVTDAHLRNPRKRRLQRSQ